MTFNRKGESFAGVCWIMVDGRELCNVCYQDDETAVMESSIPDDPLNWPRECEKCECTLTDPSKLP